MKITKNDVLEFLGAILCALLMVLLFILFVWGTPDQMSAECDLAAEQMENGGVR